MKREVAPNQPPKPLVLRRETIRALDDDALHQARGGGAARSSKFQLMAMQQE